MTTGIVMLNFGEPAEPDREVVVDYLERIFFDNASLEGETTVEEARARARQLAERRAPGLIEEYESIGGSPLQSHANAQAEALQETLREAGHDVTAHVGMQFTEPFVGDAAERARDDGADRLIAIPVYPLCGPSTTVASLEALDRALEDLEWDVSVTELTGWHRHPLYNRLRADNVRSFAAAEGLDLSGSTRLVFSAHGTPQHYLDRGSRYREYVEEYCEANAALLGVEEYELGFQNHSNRDIDWTEPEVESVVESLGEDEGVDSVAVDPISFMHEQSETLSELDVELREDAEAAGLAFHRVPVPHDDDRFVEMLAELASPALAGFDPGYYGLRRCQCRDAPGALCLNAPSTR